MSRYSSKDTNELIIKRRKKNRIKKTIMFFILLLSIAVSLCLKLEYFNIKNIYVLNNKNVTKDDIIELSSIYKGNNIFYINTNRAIEGILSNPYVYSVQIKRVLPSAINISVKEREATYYSKNVDNYLIMDKNGMVLDKKKNVDSMKLLRLEGFDFNKATIGKKLIDDDERKLTAISIMGNLIYSSKNNLGITLLDVSSSVDIKAYCGNMCIKLGTCSDLDKKLNKAINILELKQLNGAKGYIDVSFSGNPVFYVEN